MCMNENYIDDEIVRATIDLFSEHYGVGNRYIFIPPHVLELWKGHKGKVLPSWNMEHVKGGAVEKAFGVIHMYNHWGAIQVDFLNKAILFGDSLSVTSLPKEYIDAVRMWLKNVGVDLENWSKDIGVFRVAQQPPGSGSCAVNALNAIEHCVNNAVECWTHERSAYHRARILKLITEYSKLSDEECGEHVSLPCSLCSITKLSTMPVVEVNTDNEDNKSVSGESFFSAEEDSPIPDEFFEFKDDEETPSDNLEDTSAELPDVSYNGYDDLVPGFADLGVQSKSWCQSKPLSSPENDEYNIGHEGEN
ncbi:hypothetical protein BGZ76_007044, partial [Entomortierella beljakovae]